MIEDAAAVEARGALLLTLRQAGIRDVDVLRSIETIPREAFVSFRLRDLAGRNCPLPIPCGQTMEAPGALASMLEALELHPSHRVLEVGAGSGYLTAVLSRLAREVVAFERFRSLAVEARARLEQMEIVNATVFCGDGLAAPSAHGRFDRAIVSGCLPEPPPDVLAALAPDGLLVCALAAGQGEQLTLVRADGARRPLWPVRLGPALSGTAAAL